MDREILRRTEREFSRRKAISLSWSPENTWTLSPGVIDGHYKLTKPVEVQYVLVMHGPDSAVRMRYMYKCREYWYVEEEGKDFCSAIRRIRKRLAEEFDTYTYLVANRTRGLDILLNNEDKVATLKTLNELSDFVSPS